MSVIVKIIFMGTPMHYRTFVKYTHVEYTSAPSFATKFLHEDILTIIIIIMPTQNEEFEHAQPHNFSEEKQF